MKYEVDLPHEAYHDYVSGLKTFMHATRGKYKVGDIIVLREKRKSLYTGRICECKVINVYSGKLCSPEVSVLSFHITFPENEIMVPLTAFMDLQELLNASRHECERLKENYE